MVSPDGQYPGVTLHDTTAARAAEKILNRFQIYSRQFRGLTRSAKVRFEQCQWRLARQEALQRMNLYEIHLEQLRQELHEILSDRITDKAVWIDLKSAYSDLIAPLPDIDFVETFFNSITRKILQTVGINREVEYFRLEPRSITVDAEHPVFHRYHAGDRDTASLVDEILASYSFAVPFANRQRDADRVADEVNLYIWPSVHEESLDHIDMIPAPFYRNRVAYLVGRLVRGSCTAPFIMPLYNNTRGIYVDAALFRERQASIIFGFAHNPFSVDIDRPVEMIEFLRTILPRKPVADLYNSIGHYKYGKTEFYRYLHRYVHESHKRFWIAPGQEGSVMIGFTLKDFRFVFKVIKDRPCFLRSTNRTTKIVTREEVMERYQNIRYQDHVGRLVDTQEFENLRFKRKRFSSGLLREFRLAAKEAVTVDRDYVTIHHCYLQRRVIPLPLYLSNEPDPEIVRSIVLDFGYFLKDLASVGIFPADLYNIWNCGVTSRRRVVLFDHDDVTSLSRITFRRKPKPRSDWEVMQREEDWITADENDFFIDEMERFIGIPAPLVGIFRKEHGDLFTLEFWQRMQRRVRRGDVINFIPYDRSRRFA